MCLLSPYPVFLCWLDRDMRLGKNLIIIIIIIIIIGGILFTAGPGYWTGTGSLPKT